MIGKSLAIDVLNAGLVTGADFAEIYLEQNDSSFLSLENGKTESSLSSTTYGAGIRLLNKLQSVYGYTNDISRKGLMNLATSLAKSFQGERLITVEKINKVRVKNAHVYERPLSEVSREEKIALMKEAHEVISSYDKRIVRIQCSFMNNRKVVTIFNSDGKQFADFKERGRMAFVAIASENGKIETSFEGPGATAGMEFFTAKISVRDTAKRVAELAIKMLTAAECPSGKMPVVIGNGFGGVVFHEACGHSLEATAVAKKLSVFSDSLGKQIASPLVTAIDDGTIANGWGSNNIDDEGNPTQRNVLIKDGICTSFLVDSFNGRRMNAKANGACRRESYKYEPTSRMSNTFIAAGNSTHEEIIAATKLGLYAASMGGGSVNPATGEFNFSVSEAYIIRDGKIAEPVRGATLIGSGADILMKIDMVGNNLQRAQGMCGSVSGSIPADVGQPTIRVSEILVGGRGGVLK
ncbi:MAG TPA: TldD/PmbA family protein [Bacilli bacterium]|nr:TldD/PmbA family protein [Bacilli bacterium]HOF53308.1 TldD/PmbA family protein [Bacilli bacterium]HOH68212.1 TldD/PmbA family protein [Bacilli bacterium]HOR20380.1 TldD/PmbA family protein [Bacilli bacterium]HPK67489.1 TldD/PmbA family protein [Bacilli bacterium]